MESYDMAGGRGVPRPYITRLYFHVTITPLLLHKLFSKQLTQAEFCILIYTYFKFVLVYSYTTKARDTGDRR